MEDKVQETSSLKWSIQKSKKPNLILCLNVTSEASAARVSVKPVSRV